MQSQRQREPKRSKDAVDNKLKSRSPASDAQVRWQGRVACNMSYAKIAQLQTGTPTEHTEQQPRPVSCQ